MIELRPAEKIDDLDIILKDPELFDRISEDGQKVEDFIVPFDQHNLYFLAFNDGELMGVYHLHAHNQSTLVLHCNILEKHRDHATEAGHLVYDWIIEECPEQIQKFIAEIPVVYPEVYYYAKKFGWKDEGINRLSAKKRGQLVDQWRVGITRDEVTAWVQQQPSQE